MNRFKCPACGGNQYTSVQRLVPAGAAGEAGIGGTSRKTLRRLSREIN